MRDWVGAILLGIALVTLALFGLTGGPKAGASPVPVAPIVYKVTVNPAPLPVVKTSAPKVIVSVDLSQPEPPKAAKDGSDPVLADVNACSALLSEIGTVGRVDPWELEFSMHSIGCDQTPEGRWTHREGRYGAGCNRMAYDLASEVVSRGGRLVNPQGLTIQEIAWTVQDTGCNHYEDGTYGKWGS